MRPPRHTPDRCAGPFARGFGHALRPILLLVVTAEAAAAQLPDSLRIQVIPATADADSAVAPDTLRADTVDAFVPLPPEAVAHLDHLTVAFPATPGGAGLLPTGLAEARVALEHARFAAGDSISLAAVTRNVAHVLHAIDPIEVGSGNGLGYGVRRAAEETIRHAELAASVPNVPEGLRLHASYAVAAARSALLRADEAIDLARRIQRAGGGAAARPLVAELVEVVRAMGWGDDADDDGRIGYGEAEMGLAQARYHLMLVRRAARLPS